MTPQSQQRKRRNSSKVNLLISFVFHAGLVLVLLYFAARSGLLGHQLQRISVEMVKEKPPPKPKEPPKVEPPKVEPPKVEPPKVEPPKMVEAPKTAAPPASQPTVAPPAAVLPSFDFNGGKAVETSSDPVQVYKGMIEYAFRSKWDRPDDMDDDNYVAEVAISVSRTGAFRNPKWLKGSGNQRWDETVRKAIAAVTGMDRPPPTNFPSRMTVRFDIQAVTEPELQ